MRKCIISAICIILAVAMNFFGSVLARNITIPLYLDSILTFAVTALCGLWYGIACAVLTNGALCLFFHSALSFVFCHIVTAVLAYATFCHCKKRENFKDFVMDDFLWAGLWSALSNAILGNIITSLLHLPLTSPNVDNTVQGIFIIVPNLTFAVYFSGILSNLTDKMISAVLSFVMYKVGKSALNIVS